MKKRKRKLFKAVDVWQKRFSPISVQAVFDVYRQKFDVEARDIGKFQFTHCLEQLRLLEDPNYIIKNKPRERT